MTLEQKIQIDKVRDAARFITNYLLEEPCGLLLNTNCIPVRAEIAFRVDGCTFRYDPVNHALFIDLMDRDLVPDYGLLTDDCPLPRLAVYIRRAREKRLEIALPSGYLILRNT
jgi:hypothetical protein